MYEIIEPTNDFEFRIQMNIPCQLSNGIFFTKIMNNSKPIYLKTPICSTKQGILKSANGKKMVCDLLISSLETNFIYLFEKLENIIQRKFVDNAEQFLGQSIELNDIEEAFIPPTKSYKSGKFYSIRVNLTEPVNIFRENLTSIEKMLHYTDIKEDTQFIALIEISGVKFSVKTFQFEINIKQIMVVDPNPFAIECFIRKTEYVPPQKETKDPILLDANLLDLQELQEIQEIPLQEIPLQEIPLQEIPLQDINSIVNKMMDTMPTDEMPEKSLKEEQNVNDEKVLLIDINDLEVIDLGNLKNSPENELKLKTEDDFMEIYLKAKEEAKAAKKCAISAYLNLHNIKKKYNLNNLEESDEDNFD